MIKDMLPEFLTLGLEDHFMTDYGDESTYTLPWDLFDEKSALDALNSARACRSAALKVVNEVTQWRSKANADDGEDTENP